VPSEISITAAVSYKGIFDQSIYEQKDFFEKPANRILAGEALETELIKYLNGKKRERLTVVITRNAQDRLVQYQGIINEGRGFWNKFIKPLSAFLPYGMGNAFNNIEQAFSTIPKDEAKKELFKLAFELRLLEEGVDKEQVGDLEKKYILKKRNIESCEIKDQIEKALLLAREEGVYLELVRQFIDNALEMPDSSFPIEDEAVQRVTQDAFFRNFDSPLLQKLESIATKFIVNSREQNTSLTSNRCIYYFHGEPGTGKSTSARKLAEILALPCFTPPIRRVEDLSIESLEGSERTMMTHNPGLLAKALMNKNRNGKSFLNAILIIEDFDRILLANEQSGGTPPALSFLLDYLDPEKKQYFSPYFNAFVDISRLSIIITANQPIPQIRRSNGHSLPDPYAALRSRVTEVHFQNFSEDTITNILIPIADDLIRKYNLQASEYRGRTKAQFIEEAINRQKSCSATLEPRDLKRQLETVVIAYKRNTPLQPILPEEIYFRPNCCSQSLTQLGVSESSHQSSLSPNPRRRVLSQQQINQPPILTQFQPNSTASNVVSESSHQSSLSPNPRRRVSSQQQMNQPPILTQFHQPNSTASNVNNVTSVNNLKKLFES